MKYFERAFGSLLIIVGALFSWEGTRLGYISYRVPGSGFFPVWAGLFMMVGGILMTFRRLEPLQGTADIIWSKQGLIIATVALYVFMIQYLGTVVGTILYFIIALLAIARLSIWTVLLSGGISIAIIYITFEVWLKIPLSLGIFETY